MAAATAGGVLVSVGAALAIVFWPATHGVAAGLAAAGLVGLALGRRVVPLFLGALAVLLSGYAFFDRGFGYLGVPPIYVGEAVLAIAVLAIALTVPRSRLQPLHALLFAFMAWGLAATLPNLSRYGVDALRDAVLWAYAAYAIAVALAIRPTHFDLVVAWYRKLAPVFVGWVVLFGIIKPFHRADLVNAPRSAVVPLLTLKADDVTVHLAGVGAFLLIGLGPIRSSGKNLATWVRWSLWVAAVALVAAVNRGGLLALGVALGATLWLRPVRISRRWLRPVGLAALLVVAVMLVNPQFDLGRDRRFAPGEIGRSALSIVATSREPMLEATKSFRLNWWKEIVSYTVTGPYFWTGKGFGVNLADDDGFQVLPDHSLRSPHNGHMTILARMGVPGLALWIALQAMFGVHLLRAFWWARHRGGPRWSRWAQIDAWLLAYWIAMVINMAFDVYLEGPQGGIWFWSVLGLGVAALTIQDRQRRREPALQTAGLRAPLPAAH
jgi:hypothetical protein